MNIYEIIKESNLSPARVFVIGFAMIILVGAILLTMPFFTNSGQSVGFINALFTATSAVCVTGLVVVDTGTYWNIAGQIIILILIQIGGLGFMTMASLVALIIGKRISLQSRLMMQESLSAVNISGVVRLTKNVVALTLGIEALGAIFLAFRFVPMYGWAKGIYFSVFHAISAFCNAGFDIMGNFTSLTSFVDDPLVVLTISTLIILGGIGFMVMLDISRFKSPKMWTLNTKIVLCTTGILLAFGIIFSLIIEWNNPDTLGNLSFGGKLLGALFNGITPRTAGFNTVDMGLLRPSTLIVTMALMFIGGSSGSTAGGIKTSTIAIVFLNVLAITKGDKDTEVFGRRIHKEAIDRALAILGVGIMIVFLLIVLLMITEQGADMREVLFEVFSAYGTVGLSIGLTAKLTTLGKIIIAFGMFFGRLGGLTIVLALASKNSDNKAPIRYPEEKVIVG